MPQARSHTRVKVCCIASVAEAAAAVGAGADALGFVGPMPSGPGRIDDDQIRRIVPTVPPPAATFLLTSETEPSAVVDHVRRATVNTVQLVDRVAEDTYATLRAELPAVRIVQVLHVEDDRVLDDLAEVDVHVDAILLDSGRPNAPVRELGGTGRVHDWDLSRRVVEHSMRPVFLAGGLHAGNVGAAIDAVRPFGVDVCSGVRTDGALDLGKLIAFLGAVRGSE